MDPAATLSGAALPNPMRCTMGVTCEIDLLGTGLYEANRIALISSGECGTAKGGQAQAGASW